MALEMASSRPDNGGNRNGNGTSLLSLLNSGWTVLIGFAVGGVLWGTTVADLNNLKSVVTADIKSSIIPDLKAQIVGEIITSQTERGKIWAEIAIMKGNTEDLGTRLTKLESYLETRKPITLARDGQIEAMRSDIQQLKLSIASVPSIQHTLEQQEEDRNTRWAQQDATIKGVSNLLEQLRGTLTDLRVAVSAQNEKVGNLSDNVGRLSDIVLPKTAPIMPPGRNVR